MVITFIFHFDCQKPRLTSQDSGDFLTHYSAKEGNPEYGKSSEDKEEVPRLLRFSGKQADWRMWFQKFKARAKTKKYLYILTGLQKAPSALVPGGTETLEEQKDYQVMNSELSIED